MTTKETLERAAKNHKVHNTLIGNLAGGGKTGRYMKAAIHMQYFSAYAGGHIGKQKSRCCGHLGSANVTTQRRLLFHLPKNFSKIANTWRRPKF